MQLQSEARKQVLTNTNKSKESKVKKFSYLAAANEAKASEQQASISTPWKSTLDQNVSGAQTNAEDFTKQFMQEMYSSADTTSESKQQSKVVEAEIASTTTNTTVDEHYEEMMEYARQHEMHEQQRSITEIPPPALPPKTKIMFSPSRHLFSPSESVDDTSDTTSVNTVEYVPVKEKVKMIAQQQEEIVRREEIRRKTAGFEAPPGGVRILPPSPVTVPKNPMSPTVSTPTMSPLTVKKEEPRLQQQVQQQQLQQQQHREQVKQQQQQLIQQQQHETTATAQRASKT